MGSKPNPVLLLSGKPSTAQTGFKLCQKGYQLFCWCTECTLTLLLNSLPAAQHDNEVPPLHKAVLGYLTDTSLCYAGS